MTETPAPTPQHASEPPEPPKTVREEPLPDSVPKSPLEDPSAPEQLRRILESPAYVRADLDLAFLERSELRPERLELEYLKPEMALMQHHVRSTIVVFGGTRIIERRAADRRVAVLEAELAANPKDKVLERKLRVAERVRVKSGYYEVAREFAGIVSREMQK